MFWGGTWCHLPTTAPFKDFRHTTQSSTDYRKQENIWIFMFRTFFVYLIIKKKTLHPSTSKNKANSSKSKWTQDDLVHMWENTVVFPDIFMMLFFFWYYDDKKPFQSLQTLSSNAGKSFSKQSANFMQICNFPSRDWAWSGTYFLYQLCPLIIFLSKHVH